MKNFKSFLKKRKAFVITALIGVILGYGFYTNPTPEEINNLKAENTAILSNLESSQKELTTLNDNVTKLQTDISNLKEENQKRESVLTETTTKLEQQKKEEKEEAERKVKEDAEKKKQEELEKQQKAEAEKAANEQASKNSSQATSNNSSSNSSSNTANSNSSNNSSSSNSSSSNQEVSEPVGAMVYITETGSKYHSINNCGRTNPSKTSYISLSDAQSRGYSACSKCY